MLSNWFGIRFSLDSSSHRQSSTGSVVVTATCATTPLSQSTIKTKKQIARQNTLALLRPINLRGRAWKDLFTRIMKIILQEKECIH